MKEESKITTKVWHGKGLRILDKGGEPWFVAADICRCLGIVNVADATSGLDDKDKSQEPIDTGMGIRWMTVVSEKGMLGIVVQSRKQVAQEFKKWLIEYLSGTKKEMTAEDGVTIQDWYGNKIRIMDEDGKLWFVARDVCRCLDLDVKHGIRGLDDDETRLHTMVTSIGSRSFVMVSESGLYSLIGKSRKPSAHKFRSWINREVLPSIRKTGCYVSRGSDPMSPLRDEDIGPDGHALVDTSRMSNPGYMALSYAREYFALDKCRNKLTQQLDDAREQLDDAREQLDDANAQLDDANAQLDDTTAQLEMAHTQLGGIEEVCTVASDAMDNDDLTDVVSRFVPTKAPGGEVVCRRGSLVRRNPVGKMRRNLTRQAYESRLRKAKTDRAIDDDIWSHVRGRVLDQDMCGTCPTRLEQEVYDQVQSGRILIQGSILTHYGRIQKNA